MMPYMIGALVCNHFIISVGERRFSVTMTRTAVSTFNFIRIRRADPSKDSFCLEGMPLEHGLEVVLFDPSSAILVQLTHEQCELFVGEFDTKLIHLQSELILCHEAIAIAVEEGEHL